MFNNQNKEREAINQLNNVELGTDFNTMHMFTMRTRYSIDLTLQVLYVKYLVKRRDKNTS